MLGTVLACAGTAGVIVETEAYHQSEASCHAHKGPTPRSMGLFGTPGSAYVYFTYGMHWCFNVVTSPEGIGAAVLIRAVIPVHGIELMRARRQRPAAKVLRDVDLCSGPAKLTQAMEIASHHNARDVLSDATTLEELLEESAEGPRIGRIAHIPGHDDLDQTVLVGPRIGISAAQDLPWRFGYTTPYLSKRFA